MGSSLTRLFPLLLSSFPHDVADERGPHRRKTVLVRIGALTEAKANMAAATAGGESFNWDGFGQVGTLHAVLQNVCVGTHPHRVTRAGRCYVRLTNLSRDPYPSPFPSPQVQELTQRNQELLMALDMKEREIAQLSAMAETGGNAITADVRESKIVEIAKKNRTLTLALEREKAEKARLKTELKAAQAGNKDNGTPRSESQIEAACREVVAEAAEAAELAQKEAADWRERAKEAASRAERDSGRYSTVKAENDRLRLIIKREVGEAAADFSRLEDSLTAAGGWKGRAQEISLLKDKVKELKLKLAAAVAAPAVEESTKAPDSPLAKHETKLRENLAEQANKRRQDLENAEANLVAAKEELEALKRKANSAVARKAVIEKDLRGLREKMRVLTEKSNGDDKLIDALKAEIKKLAGSGGGASMRGGGLPAKAMHSGGSSQNNFAGAAVPAAVYQAVERRAQAQEQQIQQQERVVQQMQQQMLQLRAKLTSTEHQLSTSAGGGNGSSVGDDFTSSIAVAAAGLGGGGDTGGLGDQNEDDVEALIAHAEGLERLTELLRGKLAASEKQVDDLRDQLGVEHQRYVQLKARIERGGDDGAGASSPGGAGGDEEVRVLRAALSAQKDELERVQKSCKAQLEGMEQEVELYREMVQEMRAAKN